ncbi:MAG: hypothetical protein BZY80_00125 [SAR202 cluster bacterium Io17-Chloro-G2]|nr:MAG: hypothetical protein BZY80_00125 [SAR202 cluster bacterium Io17-Chloro-G2]
MDTFNVSIQLGDLDGREFVDLEALVDTGATYTTISEDMLDRLGIVKRETRSFELADDRVIEYPVGYATLRLEDREIIAMVVFAPAGTTPLLGATTLETASLAVDPVHQRLISVPALLK